MTLVSLVVFILVAMLILWFAQWILAKATVPDPAARIILVVIGLVLLLIFLQRIGLLDGSGPMIRV